MDMGEFRRVSQMDGVSNQFTIRTSTGIVFQSYGSVIAFVSEGKVWLDGEMWDYSRTTGKYRNKFLKETKAETERKIKSGEYTLINLN